MNLKELARTRRAQNNLAKKIFLEQSFIPELQSYFRSITRQFKALYSASGQILPAQEFNNKTKTVLNTQYNRVASSFVDEMRQNGGSKALFEIFYKQTETEEEKIEESVDAALVFFIALSVRDKSRLLDQTTEQNFRDSVDQAITNLQEAGLSISNAAVATEASKIAINKFEGRISNIALTETQFMSESTKAIEASAIDSGGNINVTNVIAGMALLPGIITKDWGNVGDNKVREAHIAADGQTVKINQPFIVMGERLMFPGDTSLGASAKNVARCRCSGFYSLI